MADTNRDKADEKVMATSPGNQPGREMPASMDTLNNTGISKNSSIDAYYDFGSSKCTSTENPYFKRADTIMDFLGCKDTVKG